MIISDLTVPRNIILYNLSMKLKLYVNLLFQTKLLNHHIFSKVEKVQVEI